MSLIHVCTLLDTAEIGFQEIVVERSSYISSNGIQNDSHLWHHVAPHGRCFKYPVPVLGSALNVMGIARQSLDLYNAFVRIIVPSEYPLVPRKGEPQIDQRVRVAPCCRVMMNI
jgi:hypothetical protein